MKVLVACEFSGIVRDAFRANGHDAWSCDLLPTEGDPAYHHKTDITTLLSQNSDWDLMIAHPPCTRLANSGVRWLNERNLWGQMEEDAIFFQSLLESTIPSICIENPIPHRYALQIIGRKYDQIIQPWQFGHPETKATCLWLKNLPLLTPTKIVAGRTARVHMASPGPNRRKERSRTLQGIAKAMAQQWG